MLCSSPLCPSHQFMLPSITQSLFGFAAISSYNRALCVSVKTLSVCFCSATDLNRILFVSKGKQLDQCTCVCLCAWLSGCGYQCEKSRRSRLSLNKLISRPFVRTWDRTKHDVEDERRTESNRILLKIERETRRSLSGLSDYARFADHC